MDNVGILPQRLRPGLWAKICGSYYARAFGLGLLLSILIFLPFVATDQGIFTYLGDYNVQQIPFYKHCHEMVRSGNIFWDWGTDLGVNFIGSYSFYLFGSPFFWLTIPFPGDWLPYMMAPLYCLKFATAALTGYAFIQRFCKNKNYALIGALLYAFSGFNIYNIFFNHFHDVVAFFPLLLIGIEELVVHNKKGVFALAVFLNATINYFFFVGQVVFLVLYFFVRVAYCDRWQIGLKKFGFLAFESVIGFALSSVVLLPAILAIIENPRLDSSLYGYNMIIYSNEQRYPAILQSFLFPSEIPSRPNFFASANVKWSSMAGWFPLFSLSGVFAWCMAKKRSWIKTLIIICAIMAAVPILNQAFFAFNGAYYARWYYLPILIMALATVKALEDPKIDFVRGIKWTALLTGLMVACVGLLPKKEKNEVTVGLGEYPERLWLYSAIALGCLLCIYLLVRYMRRKRNFMKILIWCTSIAIVFSSIVCVGAAKKASGNSKWIADDMVETQLRLGDEPGLFFRTDFSPGFDNLSMYWGYPSINAFHSIVPKSILDFYPTTGTERGVGSRPDVALYGLRGLLSVKYYFVTGSRSADTLLPGFEYTTSSNGVKVIKNNYFIPMGFTYDKYMSRTMYNALDEKDRDKALLKAVVLTDEQITQHKDLLQPAELEELKDVGTEQYFADCTARKAQACDTFTTDNHGFTATTTLERDNLVFFSVPFEKGWSAMVDGKPAQIEKVNIGFMAVEVPGGKEVTIRFNYETPGLNLGLVITGAAALLLALYLAIYFVSKKNGKIVAVSRGCCGRCEEDGSYKNPLPELPPEADVDESLEQSATFKERVRDFFVSPKMNKEEIDDEVLMSYYQQMQQEEQAEEPPTQDGPAGDEIEKE